jgi:hypothetical protein
MSSPNTAPAAASADYAEFDISGLEAVLAGTLCLMSAYAHCPCTNNQGLMSLKIISNLTCLQCQTRLSPEFRKVITKVSDSWRQHSLMHTGAALAVENPHTSRFWYSAPESVQ